MVGPLDPRTGVRGDLAPLKGASLLSAHDVPEHLLHDFYNTVYPRRRIPEVWRWWYRSSFHSNRTPLIIVHEQRVIAHAGIVPFRLSLAGKTWNAAWFIDFAVLPDYQRHGLGIWLTRKWMEFSDLYFTFCNEKSMGVFRKYGWKESYETHLQYLFLKPFDHPRLVKLIHPWVRRALNLPMGPALRVNYQRFAMSSNDIHLREPDERDGAAIVRPRGDPLDAQAIRDADWFRWRVLSSPDRARYRVFTVDGATLLFKVADDGSLKTADVLWVSDLTRKDTVRRMIATVAVWARRQGCSYVRFYTSDAELSRFLSRSLLTLVRRPRYAFFSQDPDLLAMLARARWDWQLIDSDFERF